MLIVRSPASLIWVTIGDGCGGGGSSGGGSGNGRGYLKHVVLLATVFPSLTGVAISLIWLYLAMTAEVSVSGERKGKANCKGDRTVILVRATLLRLQVSTRVVYVSHLLQ